MADKKAVLVRFSVGTRVIVAGNATEDEIIQAARARILSDPDNYLQGDNVDELEDDAECPYYPRYDG